MIHLILTKIHWCCQCRKQTLTPNWDWVSFKYHQHKVINISNIYIFDKDVPIGPHILTDSGAQSRMGSRNLKVWYPALVIIIRIENNICLILIERTSQQNNTCWTQLWLESVKLLVQRPKVNPHPQILCLCLLVAPLLVFHLRNNKKNFKRLCESAQWIEMFQQTPRCRFRHTPAYITWEHRLIPTVRKMKMKWKHNENTAEWWWRQTGRLEWDGW